MGEVTGVDRLRELAREQEERSWSSVGKVRARMMARIADQIEREHAEDCSRVGERADEDAGAVAWVREHGGLSHVKDICHDFRAVVERLGIEWSESELHGLMDVLDKRLMPKGMEWPRFEDGKPVRLGDAFSYGDETFYVDSVQLLKREFHLWATNGKVVTGSNGERCEHPDSWDRLEEDVANASRPDVYCANHYIDASDASYEWAMARDIVRRAKALAGDA